MSRHSRLILIVLAFLCFGKSLIAQSYVWINYAGKPGIAGGQNGRGTEATFSAPRQIAISGNGELFIADAGNHVIRKISTSGIVSTFAGSVGNAGNADGLGEAARFSSPKGVAVDRSGNVYVGDTANQTVRKITPAGLVSTLAGSPGVVGAVDGIGSAARFINPYSLSVNFAGTIFVSESESHIIRKISPSSSVETFAGMAGIQGYTNGTGSIARFRYPAGIALDSSESLFVADLGADTIRKVSISGAVTTLAGSPASGGGSDGTGSGARFDGPIGMSVDGSGNLYITEKFNHTIRKMSATGVVTTIGGIAPISGTTDGVGSSARFFEPHGIAAASDGSLFVCDTANNRISRGTLATLPTAPDYFEAQAFADHVSLGWADNSNNESGFKIERRLSGGAFIQIATTGPNPAANAFYTDTTTFPYATYTYRVRAFSPVGDSSYSNEATLTTPAGKPGVFTLSNNPPVWDSAIQGPKVQLNWTASSDAGAYVLYRDGSVYIAGLTGTAFLNSANLSGGSTYTYFVRASNSEGTTDSNSIVITMPTAPATVPQSPSSLALSAGSGLFSLAWNDNSNNETGFKIERKIGLVGNYSQIATTGQDIAAYIDTGIVPSTTYYYRVKAYNLAGDSGYSNVVSVMSSGGGPGPFTLSSDEPVWDSTIPGPKIQLRWSVSTGAISYTLFRNGSIYANSISGTSFLNSANLGAGSIYTYFVRATNADGTTDSNPITVGPLPSAVSGPPGSFTLSSAQPIWDPDFGPAVQLNWSTSNNATSYDLYSGAGTVLATNLSARKLYFHTGLLSGLTYSFYAMAKNATGTQQSNTISVGPMVSAPAAGEISVFGRVIDGETGYPLSATTATFGGILVVTSTSGAFRIPNPNLTLGSVLRIGHAGFFEQTRTISIPAGTKSFSVGDIALIPLGNKPVVEWIKPDVEGIYLAGFGLQPPLKTKVNWNGSTAGSVTVMVNGRTFATLTGAGPEYTTPGLAVDVYLPPSFNPKSNKVSVQARNSAGQDSDPVVLPLAVIPVPAAVARVVNSSLYKTFGPDQLGIDFTLFPVEQDVTIPLLGKFGFEFGLNTSFDYTISDGAWELALGLGAEGDSGKRGGRPAFPGLIRVPQMKLYLGNKEITGKVAAKATGTATLTSGITLAEVGGSAEVKAKLELGRYSPLDIIPGLTTLLSSAPGLEKKLRNASMIIYAKPGLEGNLNWRMTPELAFKDATIEGTLGLEAAYEPKIGKLEGRIYIGGEGRTKFGLPAPVFREIGLKFYVGYKISAWIFEAEKEWPWAEYTYPPTPSVGGRFASLNGEKIIDASWHVSSRLWRNAGQEAFLQANKMQAVVAPLYVGTGSSGISPELDVFNRMGAGKAVPLANGGKGGIVPKVIPSDSNLPAQAVLPLLTNVFPGSEPALAQRNGELMLLYVRDTGVANPVQFTEIAYTRYDGATWSTPVAVAPDARAQFAPQVMFAGNGDAVAVWERVNDAAFTSVDDPLALGAHMEIVWSRWTPATGTWSAPVALTANAVVDHSPHLAGPLADGNLFLTWIRNNGNKLAGEGAVGAVTNDQAMVARWDTATLTWNTPTVLVDELTGDLSHSFAATGGKAVYAWTKDMDGNLDNLTDTEVFVRTWDGAVGVGGTWSAATRVTNDTLPEGTVRVVVDPSGSIYPLWQHGTDLVMQKNFTGALAVVRVDSGTMGFADFALTAGPGGNVLALWQEMTEAGSDAHYRVYDPASSTWGLDTLLSNDAALERSFAPVWDSVGNLVVAYNNVDIVKLAKTVVGAGGVSTTIQGVPQPGQVNLLVARRALVKDLSFLADSLVATGTNFLPGDALTIKATVRNTGNLAVENVVVSFYDGDPSAGGTLIQAVTVAGWLKASDQREVSMLWTVPGAVTTPHTIFSVVDQAATVTEQDETNNKVSLSLGGTDLDLHYLNGSVLADGSVRVVARIKNLGAPSSPVAELKLWPKDNPGANPLVSVNVSQLAPGESVEVPLDLPAGAQPEGDRSYRLTVNEAYLATEANAENNATIFSLTLWIDNDNDGMPAGWEAANGLSDSDAEDAGVDSDGDGFTNVQEYLAGTNPRNAASRLKAEEWSVRTVPGTSGHEFTVSWASVAGHSYVVERSFNMAQWAVIATGVQATPPLNTFADTVEAAEAKVFYRIRAQ